MNKQYYQFGIQLLLLVAFFFAVAPAKAETGLKISGYVVVSTYDPMGEALPTPLWGGTNRFCISLASDGRYLLELQPLAEDEDKIYQSFDGSDTIFVRYREADIDMLQNVIGRTPVSKKVNPAYVSSGNYPFAPWDQQKRANILWMAYCMGHYLHTSKTNTMPLPWVPSRWSLAAYGYRVDAKESIGPPHILKDAVFVRDDKYDLTSFSEEIERPELDAPSAEKWISQWKSQYKERKHKWKNGFVVGTLENSNFTNYFGIDFPRDFTVKTFSPDWNGNKVRWKYIGYVTNVSLLTYSDREGFQPPITGTVGVQDSRFRHKDPKKAINAINYDVTATNGWCSKEDKQKIKQLDAGLASREVSARLVYGATRTRRLIFAGLFLVTFLCLPLFLYKQIKQKKL